MMKNIFILLVIAIMTLTSAYALDVNDTLRINAEYRENGILTSANASISIFLPSSKLSIDNASMNITGTGKFLYDYVIPDHEGEYSVHIDYYNSTAWLGDEDDYFIVGSVNKLNWGYCPNSTTGYFGLWILFIIILAVGFLGYLSQSAGITFVSAVLFIFLSTISWGCGDIIGIATIIIGMLFLIISASLKF